MMKLRGEFLQHLPPALTDSGDARGEPDPALRDSMLLITILGAFLGGHAQKSRPILPPVVVGLSRFTSLKH
jgi:hypothetical protein